MNWAGGPEIPRSRQRIDLHVRPPCLFITFPVQGLMVGPTQRNGKLVTDLAPERALLREFEMVRIHRGPLTDETRQSADETEMCLASLPRKLLGKSKAATWIRKPVMWLGGRQPQIQRCQSACKILQAE